MMWIIPIAVSMYRANYERQFLELKCQTTPFVG